VKQALAVLAAVLALGALDLQAREPGWKTMKDNALGCQDRPEFERLSSMRSSGDRAAFTQAATPAFVAGRCVVLDKGTEVYLEDVAMWSGVAKVRPRGSAIAYWMYFEHLY
jgi:hypothetical protein